MYIIEPCCTKKNLLALRSAVKDGRKARFEGYGDMSLTELLPAILTRYSETEIIIAAPAIPDQAARAIDRCMRIEWGRAEGNGKLSAIGHLTIISALSKRKSPMASAWKKDNPYGDRLRLVYRQQQTDTVILLPDIAFVGPVNLRYGEHFTAVATTKREELDELWRQYTTTDKDEEDEQL